MSKRIDENKSLEELEQDYWKDYDFPTSLIAKCHECRKIPLKDLTIEQIRLLIGQDIGLKYLIPKTIEILKTNILAEGDLYPGDLLSAVLASDAAFWANNKSLRLEVENLVDSKKDEILDKKLLQKMDKFRIK